ncbi:MAG: EscU/YscU/HrcU family type III secretion system export apparatus switch protein [Chromatocurvus sp.]
MENSTPPGDRSAALRYTGVGAPRLVASGENAVAAQIREIARANDVPLVQDAALTELLCALPLGDEIPETLYLAVAEVLAFVYRLNAELDEEA